MNIKQLQANAYEIRKEIIKICYQSKAGHLGGSLSSTDILNVLYFNILNIDASNPRMENRDRFILSKGHIAETLFIILAKRGFFDIEELESFSTFKSKYIGHPNNKVTGIEVNTGALGHGLALGVGSAIAAKKLDQSYHTYVLLGDGELAEGSIWESAMAASHYQLDNLCAIIDRNRLQISGSTEDVMALENLKDKWLAFGFEVLEIDGHDYDQILSAFKQARLIKLKPTLILANTVKGKGVSFMENQASWHHGILNDTLYQQALKELEETSNESKYCQ